MKRWRPVVASALGTVLVVVGAPMLGREHERGTGLVIVVVGFVLALFGAMGMGLRGDR